MLFSVPQSKLLDLLNKTCSVATKGIRESFDEPKRVHIKCTKDKVTLVTSNGNMDAKFEFDVTDAEPGSAIVGVEIFRNVVKNLGGTNKDTLCSVSLEDNVLKVLDSASKNKKKFAKIETYPVSKIDFKFTKPSKPLISHTFEQPTFHKVVKTLARYAGAGYKEKFHHLVLHFLGDVSRFVCGDGSRFAVLETATPGVKPDENMYLLNAVQAEIVADISGECNKVSVTFSEKGGCFLELDDGTELVVKGIKDEQYINYSKHVAIKKDAKNIIDVKRSDFIQGINLVESVKDPNAKSYQTAIFKATGDELEMAIEDEKNGCSYATEIKMNSLTEVKSFSSRYAAAHFRDSISSFNKEYMRFYCIEETGTLVVEPCDLLDSRDENNIPLVKEDNSERLIFFFSSTREA